MSSQIVQTKTEKVDAIQAIHPILQGPVSLRLHNLQDYNESSAIHDAKRILDEVKANTGMNMSMFEVHRAYNTERNRRPHSVVIQFKKELYKSPADLPDETLMSKLGEAIESIGKEVRWSSSPNYDRITLLKFEWMDPFHRDLPDEEAVRTLVRDFMKRKGINATQIFGVKVEFPWVRGYIGVKSVVQRDELIDQRSFSFSSAAWVRPVELKFYPHPLYIPVTYCTALCLYVGDVERGSNHELEADAKRILKIVGEKFPGEEVYGTNFQRSSCGSYFTFNPSRPAHALETTKYPSTVSSHRFYESAYIHNSSLANFKLETLYAKNDAKWLDYNSMFHSEIQEGCKPPECFVEQLLPLIPIKRRRRHRLTFEERMIEVAKSSKVKLSLPQTSISDGIVPIAASAKQTSTTAGPSLDRSVSDSGSI